MDAIQHNRAGLVYVEFLALVSEMCSVMCGNTMNAVDHGMQTVLHDATLAEDAQMLFSEFNDLSIALMCLARDAGRLSGMNERELLDRTFEKLWESKEVEYRTDNGDPEFRGCHAPATLLELARKYNDRIAFTPPPPGRRYRGLDQS